MPTTFGALADTWLARYLADKKLWVVTAIFGLCVLAELLGIDIPGFTLDENWLLVLFGMGAVTASKSDAKVTAVAAVSRSEPPPTFI